MGSGEFFCVACQHWKKGEPARRGGINKALKVCAECEDKTRSTPEYRRRANINASKKNYLSGKLPPFCKL